MHDSLQYISTVYIFAKAGCGRLTHKFRNESSASGFDGGCRWRATGIGSWRGEDGAFDGTYNSLLGFSSACRSDGRFKPRTVNEWDAVVHVPLGQQGLAADGRPHGEQELVAGPSSRSVERNGPRNERFRQLIHSGCSRYGWCIAIHMHSLISTYI
jgi:hypothetical protein